MKEQKDNRYDTKKIKTNEDDFGTSGIWIPKQELENLAAEGASSNGNDDYDMKKESSDPTQELGLWLSWIGGSGGFFLLLVTLLPIFEHKSSRLFERIHSIDLFGLAGA